MRMVLLSILVLFAVPTMAQEQFIVMKHVGYMQQEITSSTGKKYIINTPVYGMPEDNDLYYKYRDYEREMERVQKEDQDDRNKEMTSAAYYPLYFDN